MLLLHIMLYLMHSEGVLIPSVVCADVAHRHLVYCTVCLHQIRKLPNGWVGRTVG